MIGRLVFWALIELLPSPRGRLIHQIYKSWENILCRFVVPFHLHSELIAHTCLYDPRLLIFHFLFLLMPFFFIFYSVGNQAFSISFIPLTLGPTPSFLGELFSRCTFEKELKFTMAWVAHFVASLVEGWQNHLWKGVDNARWLSPHLNTGHGDSSKSKVWTISTHDVNISVEPMMNIILLNPYPMPTLVDIPLEEALNVIAKDTHFWRCRIMWEKDSKLLMLDPTHIFTFLLDLLSGQLLMSPPHHLLFEDQAIFSDSERPLLALEYLYLIFYSFWDIFDMCYHLERVEWTQLLIVDTNV